MEEPEVDRLYELPLDQFTPARDQLAARLKMAGDAHESSRIKGLRKPTTPAWVVNQLSRRHPSKVEALVSASDLVRRAQQEVLEGGTAGDLWEATLAEREAVSSLVRDAEKIFTDAGFSATRGALDRVADTLTAAASDPSGRSLLRKGLLTQEMRRAGFGDVISAPAQRAKAEPKRAPLKAVPSRGKAKPGPRKKGPTAKQVLEAEREAQRAERAAERAANEAERLARASRRADDEATQARKRAEAAARSARAAAADATASAKSAAEASREAARAQIRLEKLRRKRP